MRLIAEFKHEKEAFGFHTYLQNHGVKSVYDSTGEGIYRVWGIEEDDFEKAVGYLNEWKKDPFSVPEELPPSTPHPSWKVRMEAPRFSSPISLTNILIIVCGFLFFWTLAQMGRLEQQHGKVALQYELVPLQQQLMFDHPEYLANFQKFFEEYDVKTEDELKALPPDAEARFNKIEKAPTWKGVADMVVTRNWGLLENLPEGTLFGKIRQGEVWRLISPVLLHGGVLHILFNMAWLYILGRQVEERLGKFRYLFLSILLGVISNVAQYLVSGPIFLGYSGIITGLVGFIWMRQKIAPWEGYPLQRPVIVFITVFVFAMLGLEIISMALQFFNVTDVYANIANTAHIIGGFTGVILGKLPFFSRGRP